MEETLYDISGTLVAYITYDYEPIIYMWNGKPVVYLDQDCIYGFNGKHLGWFENGYIRDLLGFIVGFNKYATDVFLVREPYKSFKQFQPFKNFKELKKLKPLYSRVKSSESLSVFLKKGTK